MASVNRETWIFASFLVLLMGVAACGGTEEATHAPATTVAAEQSGPTFTATVTSLVEQVDPTPVATVTVDMDQMALTTPALYLESNDSSNAVEGAGTPSLLLRLDMSDVVVRATLKSVSDGTLTFNALEYLKGNGPREIIVKADTYGRDTKWDKVEAVLFLELPATSAEYIFTDADHLYTGNLPGGYEIGTSNPMWLPAGNAGGGSGSSGSVKTYITDLPAGEGKAYPVVSLADLRSKIAWMEAGEGIEGYDDCIGAVIFYEQFYKDAEEYSGKAWTALTYKVSIASGERVGTLVDDSGSHPSEMVYGKSWLIGTDANLFSAKVVDNDKVASNGYEVNITTARPLPAGKYSFRYRTQGGYFIPCNFLAEKAALDYEVTVTAPAGTVHEAFFDPAIIGSAVGADASNGVLKPTSFTHGDVSSSIVRLGWGEGEVTLVLSRYVSLAGKTLDFIELDGTVGLSLGFDDGVSGGESGRVVWKVDKQPWESGDRLMIRIR